MPEAIVTSTIGATSMRIARTNRSPRNCDRRRRRRPDQREDERPAPARRARASTAQWRTSGATSSAARARRRGVRQRAAGRLAGQHALVDREHAVDEHGLHARRKQRRLLDRWRASDRSWDRTPRHRQRRPAARWPRPARWKPVRRQRRAALDELAQRQHMIGDDIFGVFAGKGAIDARMRRPMRRSRSSPRAGA